MDQDNYMCMYVCYRMYTNMVIWKNTKLEIPF